jgi:CheY-like chemotaxis protein
VRRRHVLVIDDDPAVREAIAEVLYREGYTVCVAESTSAAIAKLTLCRPDVAIVDLVLEVPFDTLRSRRVMWALRVHGVPAVGLAANRERAATLAAGAREVLAKPFHAEALLGALKRALEAPEGDPDV